MGSYGLRALVGASLMDVRMDGAWTWAWCLDLVLRSGGDGVLDGSLLFSRHVIGCEIE